MRPDLGARPRFDVLLNLAPLIAIETKSLDEASVLLVGPTASHLLLLFAHPRLHSQHGALDSRLTDLHNRRLAESLQCRHRFEGRRLLRLRVQGHGGRRVGSKRLIYHSPTGERPLGLTAIEAGHFLHLCIHIFYLYLDGTLFALGLTLAAGGKWISRLRILVLLDGGLPASELSVVPLLLFASGNTA